MLGYGFQQDQETGQPSVVQEVEAGMAFLLSWAGLVLGGLHTGVGIPTS